MAAKINIADRRKTIIFILLFSHVLIVDWTRLDIVQWSAEVQYPSCEQQGKSLQNGQK